jgi:hypothetical protein
MRLSQGARSINSTADHTPLLRSWHEFSPMLLWMHPVIGLEEGAGERN